jgi:hypothetical protein
MLPVEVAADQILDSIDAFEANKHRLQKLERNRANLVSKLAKLDAEIETTQNAIADGVPVGKKGAYKLSANAGHNSGEPQPSKRGYLYTRVPLKPDHYNMVKILSASVGLTISSWMASRAIVVARQEIKERRKQ